MRLQKYRRHPFDLVLGSLLLLLVPQVLPAQNGPELPSWPEARRGFVPGSQVPVEPTVRYLQHAARDGAGFSGALPVEVSFSALAQKEVPQTVGPLLSYFQGDSLEGYQTSDPAVGVARVTESIDSSRPQVFTRSSTGEVTTNFDGLAATGSIPPDTVVAVGPGHVVEGVNSGLAVYSKAGAALQGYTTFDAFFDSVKPPGWAGVFFEPRVLFSPENGEFVLLALGIDQANEGSYFFIAVSQTDDPTGFWWLRRLSSNLGGVNGDAFLEYSGLGADTWGVYVTGNYFFWSGGYKYSTIITLGPSIFSGGSAAGWQFLNLQWPNASNASSLQPALPLSVSGSGETFFVNSWSASGSQLLLWRLTGDRTNNPTLSRAAVDVNAYSAINQNIDQPGSPTHIDGGDSRIVNAFYSQRRVYTSLTSNTNANATSSGAFVAKVNIDSLLAEWNTTLDGGAGSYYFYPAVVIGDAALTSPSVSLFLSWTIPAQNHFASAAVRTYLGPPANMLGEFPTLAAGEAAYVALDNNNRNRWGDYTGAGFDFTNGTVWGAVEYAGPTNTWRTRIAELSTPLFADGFESGSVLAWQ